MTTAQHAELINSRLAQVASELGITDYEITPELLLRAQSEWNKEGVGERVQLAMQIIDMHNAVFMALELELKEPFPRYNSPWSVLTGDLQQG